VLLVHGRDFKPEASRLLELCREALVAGFARDVPEQQALIEDVDLELAWYGDLTADILGRHGRHYDERLDLGDRRNALGMLKQVAERKRFGIRQYDRLPAKSAVGEFIADTALPVLGSIGLWHRLCRRHAPDFDEYLRGQSDYAALVRERVRAPLAAMLAGGERVAVLSHGTGSVVTWDVLRELSGDEPAGKVDLWVTLGSPLGDAQVQKCLNRGNPDRATRFPGNVINWSNVSAEDDFTCHDKTLADDYRRMMDDRLVSVISDYRIYNLAVRYGKSNPHSSIGYYIHPRVTKILADWLGAIPRSRP
jgi:hypothetical protein